MLPPDDPADVAKRRLFAWLSTTIVLSLAILSYVLRIWARKKSGQKLKWDDWLMGIGLVISTEPAICEYLCNWQPPSCFMVCEQRKFLTLQVMANGLGHHIWNVPVQEIHRFGKVRSLYSLRSTLVP